MLHEKLYAKKGKYLPNPSTPTLKLPHQVLKVKLCIPLFTGEGETNRLYATCNLGLCLIEYGVLPGVSLSFSQCQ